MHERTAPRTMILLDPKLDLSAAADAPNPIPANPPAGSTSAFIPRNLRLPSARALHRSLCRFLAEAQAAVRLRGQVSVLLTTDAALRDLNRRFRGKNRPTDVLSFPATKLFQDEEIIAGDIAISVPTARRQGTACGHTLGTELKILILHGLLHMAGYDHETDAGQMHRRERELRAQLGLPLGLIERGRTERESRPKLRRTAGARRTQRASRSDARKIAPDGVRRGTRGPRGPVFGPWGETRRTQSGVTAPDSRKPRRGGGNASTFSTRSRAQ